MEASAQENQPQLTKKQKKAAKRAAFIRDIVVAVRNDLYPGYGGSAPSQPLGPFALAFRKWEANRKAVENNESDAIELLGWAKYVRLLPTEATKLPSEEVQQYLINLNNSQVAKAQSDNNQAAAHPCSD